MLAPDSNMNILDTAWYAATRTVGMVLCEDTVTGQTMAFLGPCDPDCALTEAEDSVQIAQWGAKMNKTMAEAQFGPLKNYKY